MASSGFKSRSSFFGASGFGSSQGFNASSGFSPTDNPATEVDLIDFSAQGAVNYGYSSFEPITYLPFGGSGAAGLDVSQSDAAKQPALENIKTYAVTGTDTSNANELAVNGQGVLIEGEATNDFADSLNYTGANWDKENVIPVDNSVLAPDGTTTASTITTEAALTGSQLRISSGFATTIGDRVERLQYIKIPSTTDLPYLIFQADRSGGNITYEIATGEIIRNGTGGNGSLDVTSINDGWLEFRFIYTATATDTFDNQLVYFSNRTNGGFLVAPTSGGDVFHFWDSSGGPNFTGPPIRTNGTPVTRQADSITSTTTGLPVNDFVWEVDFTALDNPADGVIVENSLTDPTARNIISREAGGFRYSYEQGSLAVTSSAIPDISNKRWLLRVTKDSVNGTTLNVFEKDFKDSQTDLALIGSVPEWSGAKTYGERQGGLFPTNMILHRETMTNLDGSVVYSNYEPEGLAAGGYASIDSTVNNLTLTNQNPSGKTFDVYSLTASEPLIAFDQGDQLSNVTIPADTFYGAITVLDVAYNANDLGSQNVVASYLTSVRLAAEDGFGYLQFSLASIDIDPVTNTLVFDGQRRVIAGGVGGDGVNTFCQVSVDGVIEDFSQNASTFWPAQLAPFTPENRQDVYAYKLVFLTEPVTSQEQLDNLVVKISLGI